MKLRTNSKTALFLVIAILLSSLVLALQVPNTGDYDNDGDDDIVAFQIINNQNNGTYFEVNEYYGIVPENATYGFFIDLNTSDSYLDVYLVYENNTNKLLRYNSTSSNFTDITATAGVGGNESDPIGANTADFNNDGRADLYANNKLYISNGDFTFNDSTNLSNLAEFPRLQWVVAWDFNEDNRTDIIGVSERGNITLMLNLGDSNSDNVPEFWDATAISRLSNLTKGVFANSIAVGWMWNWTSSLDGITYRVTGVYIPINGTDILLDTLYSSNFYSYTYAQMPELRKLNLSALLGGNTTGIDCNSTDAIFGDFDNNGIMDIAVLCGNSTSSSITYLIRNGTGTYVKGFVNAGNPVNNSGIGMPNNGRGARFIFNIPNPVVPGGKRGKPGAGVNGGNPPFAWKAYSSGENGTANETGGSGIGASSDEYGILDLGGDGETQPTPPPPTGKEKEEGTPTSNGLIQPPTTPDVSVSKGSDTGLNGLTDVKGSLATYTPPEDTTPPPQPPSSGGRLNKTVIIVPNVTEEKEEEITKPPKEEKPTAIPSQPVFTVTDEAGPSGDFCLVNWVSYGPDENAVLSVEFINEIPNIDYAYLYHNEIWGYDNKISEGEMNRNLQQSHPPFKLSVSSSQLLNQPVQVQTGNLITGAVVISQSIQNLGQGETIHRGFVLSTVGLPAGEYPYKITFESKNIKHEETRILTVRQTNNFYAYPEILIEGDTAIVSLFMNLPAGRAGIEYSLNEPIAVNGKYLPGKRFPSSSSLIGLFDSIFSGARTGFADYVEVNPSQSTPAIASLKFPAEFIKKNPLLTVKYRASPEIAYSFMFNSGTNAFIPAESNAYGEVTTEEDACSEGGKCFGCCLCYGYKDGKKLLYASKPLDPTNAQSCSDRSIWQADVQKCNSSDLTSKFTTATSCQNIPFTTTPKEMPIECEKIVEKPKIEVAEELKPTTPPVKEEPKQCGCCLCIHPDDKTKPHAVPLPYLGRVSQKECNRYCLNFETEYRSKPYSKDCGTDPHLSQDQIETNLNAMKCRSDFKARDIIIYDSRWKECATTNEGCFVTEEKEPVVPNPTGFCCKCACQYPLEDSLIYSLKDSATRKRDELTEKQNTKWIMLSPTPNSCSTNEYGACYGYQNASYVCPEIIEEAEELQCPCEEDDELFWLNPPQKLKGIDSGKLPELIITGFKLTAEAEPVQPEEAVAKVPEKIPAEIPPIEIPETPEIPAIKLKEPYIQIFNPSDKEIYLRGYRIIGVMLYPEQITPPEEMVVEPPEGGEPETSPEGEQRRPEEGYPPQCDDSFDNDNDGYIDYPADPGCESYTDDDESNRLPPSEGYVPECSDSLDNDNDGYVDYPSDPGCTRYPDDDESNSINAEIRAGKRLCSKLNPAYIPLIVALAMFIASLGYLYSKKTPKRYAFTAIMWLLGASAVGAFNYLSQLKHLILIDIILLAAIAAMMFYYSIVKQKKYEALTYLLAALIPASAALFTYIYYSTVCTGNLPNIALSLAESFIIASAVILAAHLLITLRMLTKLYGINLLNASRILTALLAAVAAVIAYYYIAYLGYSPFKVIGIPVIMALAILGFYYLRKKGIFAAVLVISLVISMTPAYAALQSDAPGSQAVESTIEANQQIEEMNTAASVAEPSAAPKPQRQGFIYFNLEFPSTEIINEITSPAGTKIAVPPTEVNLVIKPKETKIIALGDALDFISSYNTEPNLENWYKRDSSEFSNMIGLEIGNTGKELGVDIGNSLTLYKKTGDAPPIIVDSVKGDDFAAKVFGKKAPSLITGQTIRIDSAGKKLVYNKIDSLNLGMLGAGRINSILKGLFVQEFMPEKTEYRETTMFNGDGTMTKIYSDGSTATYNPDTGQITKTTDKYGNEYSYEITNEWLIIKTSKGETKYADKNTNKIIYSIDAAGVRYDYNYLEDRILLQGSDGTKIVKSLDDMFVLSKTGKDGKTARYSYQDGKIIEESESGTVVFDTEQGRITSIISSEGKATSVDYTDGETIYSEKDTAGRYELDKESGEFVSYTQKLGYKYTTESGMSSISGSVVGEADIYNNASGLTVITSADRSTKVMLDKNLLAYKTSDGVLFVYVYYDNEVHLYKDDGTMQVLDRYTGEIKYAVSYDAEGNKVYEDYMYNPDGTISIANRETKNSITVDKETGEILSRTEASEKTSYETPVEHWTRCGDWTKTAETSKNFGYWEKLTAPPNEIIYDCETLKEQTAKPAEEIEFVPKGITCPAGTSTKYVRNANNEDIFVCMPEIPALITGDVVKEGDNEITGMQIGIPIPEPELPSPVKWAGFKPEHAEQLPPGPEKTIEKTINKDELDAKSEETSVNSKEVAILNNQDELRPFYSSYFAQDVLDAFANIKAMKQQDIGVDLTKELKFAVDSSSAAVKESNEFMKFASSVHDFRQMLSRKLKDVSSDFVRIHKLAKGGYVYDFSMIFDSTLKKESDLIKLAENKDDKWPLGMQQLQEKVNPSRPEIKALIANLMIQTEELADSANKFNLNAKEELENIRKISDDIKEHTSPEEIANEDNVKKIAELETAKIRFYSWLFDTDAAYIKALNYYTKAIKLVACSYSKPPCVYEITAMDIPSAEGIVDDIRNAGIQFPDEDEWTLTFECDEKSCTVWSKCNNQNEQTRVCPRPPASIPCQVIKECEPKKPDMRGASEFEKQIEKKIEEIKEKGKEIEAQDKKTKEALEKAIGVFEEDGRKYIEKDGKIYEIKDNELINIFDPNDKQKYDPWVIANAEGHRLMPEEWESIKGLLEKGKALAEEYNKLVQGFKDSLAKEGWQLNEEGKRVKIATEQQKQELEQAQKQTENLKKAETKTKNRQTANSGEIAKLQGEIEKLNEFLEALKKSGESSPKLVEGLIGKYEVLNYKELENKYNKMEPHEVEQVKAYLRRLRELENTKSGINEKLNGFEKAIKALQDENNRLLQKESELYKQLRDAESKLEELKKLGDLELVAFDGKKSAARTPNREIIVIDEKGIMSKAGFVIEGMLYPYGEIRPDGSMAVIRLAKDGKTIAAIEILTKKQLIEELKKMVEAGRITPEEAKNLGVPNLEKEIRFEKKTLELSKKINELKGEGDLPQYSRLTDVENLLEEFKKLKELGSEIKPAKLTIATRMDYTKEGVEQMIKSLEAIKAAMIASEKAKKISEIFKEFKHDETRISHLEKLKEKYGEDAGINEQIKDLKTKVLLEEVEAIRNRYPFEKQAEEYRKLAENPLAKETLIKLPEKTVTLEELIKSIIEELKFEGDKQLLEKALKDPRAQRAIDEYNNLAGAIAELSKEYNENRITKEHLDGKIEFWNMNYIRELKRFAEEPENIEALREAIKSLEESKPVSEEYKAIFDMMKLMLKDILKPAEFITAMNKFSREYTEAARIIGKETPEREDIKNYVETMAKALENLAEKLKSSLELGDLTTEEILKQFTDANVESLKDPREHITLDEFYKEIRELNIDEAYINARTAKILEEYTELISIGEIYSPDAIPMLEAEMAKAPDEQKPFYQKKIDEIRKSWEQVKEVLKANTEEYEKRIASLSELEEERKKADSAKRMVELESEIEEIKGLIGSEFAFRLDSHLIGLTAAQRKEQLYELANKFDEDVRALKKQIEKYEKGESDVNEDLTKVHETEFETPWGKYRLFTNKESNIGKVRIELYKRLSAVDPEYTPSGISNAEWELKLVNEKIPKLLNELAKDDSSINRLVRQREELKALIYILKTQENFRKEIIGEANVHNILEERLSKLIENFYGVQSKIEGIGRKEKSIETFGSWVDPNAEIGTLKKQRTILINEIEGELTKLSDYLYQTYSLDGYYLKKQKQEQLRGRLKLIELADRTKAELMLMKYSEYYRIDESGSILGYIKAGWDSGARIGPFKFIKIVSGKEEVMKEYNGLINEANALRSFEGNNLDISKLSAEHAKIIRELGLENARELSKLPKYAISTSYNTERMFTSNRGENLFDSMFNPEALLLMKGVSTLLNYGTLGVRAAAKAGTEILLKSGNRALNLIGRGLTLVGEKALSPVLKVATYPYEISNKFEEWIRVGLQKKIGTYLAGKASFVSSELLLEEVGYFFLPFKDTLEMLYGIIAGKPRVSSIVTKITASQFTNKFQEYADKLAIYYHKDGRVYVNEEHPLYKEFKLTEIKSAIAHERAHELLHKINSRQRVKIFEQIRSSSEWESTKSDFLKLYSQLIGRSDYDIISEMFAKMSEFRYAAPKLAVEQSVINRFENLLDSKTIDMFKHAVTSVRNLKEKDFKPLEKVLAMETAVKSLEALEAQKLTLENKLKKMAASTPEQYKNLEMVDVIENAQRVIPIPDVHGGFIEMLEIFENAGILKKGYVDKYKNTRFELTKAHIQELYDSIQIAKIGTVIVSTGDYMDRGFRNLEVIEFLSTFEKIVAEKGGKYIGLAGNHDIAIERLMLETKNLEPEKANLIVNLRWSGYKFGNTLNELAQKYAGKSWKQVVADNKIDDWNKIQAGFEKDYKPWLEQRKLAAIVNNNFFTHGGPNLNVNNLIELNEHYKQLRKSLLETDEGHLELTIEQEEKVVSGDWDGQYAEKWAFQPDVVDFLKKFNVNRIIVGHSPSRAINQLRKEVIKIDSAMSPGYTPNGNPEYLELTTEGIIAHRPRKIATQQQETLITGTAEPLKLTEEFKKLKNELKSTEKEIAEFKPKAIPKEQQKLISKIVEDINKMPMNRPLRVIIKSIAAADSSLLSNAVALKKDVALTDEDMRAFISKYPQGITEGELELLLEKMGFLSAQVEATKRIYQQEITRIIDDFAKAAQTMLEKPKISLQQLEQFRQGLSPESRRLIDVLGAITDISQPDASAEFMQKAIELSTKDYIKVSTLDISVLQEFLNKYPQGIDDSALKQFLVKIGIQSAVIPGYTKTVLEINNAVQQAKKIAEPLVEAKGTFELQSKIGEGTWKEVYLGVYTYPDGQKVAAVLSRFKAGGDMSSNLALVALAKEHGYEHLFPKLLGKTPDSLIFEYAGISGEDIITKKTITERDAEALRNKWFEDWNVFAELVEEKEGLTIRTEARIELWRDFGIIGNKLVWLDLDLVDHINTQLARNKMATFEKGNIEEMRGALIPYSDIATDENLLKEKLLRDTASEFKNDESYIRFTELSKKSDVLIEKAKSITDINEMIAIWKEISQLDAEMRSAADKWLNKLNTALEERIKAPAKPEVADVKEQITTDNKIGEGAYGVTYKASYGAEEYLIKVPKTYLGKVDKAALDMLKDEIEITKQISDKFYESNPQAKGIVRFVSSLETDTEAYLIVEYIPNALILEEHLKQNRPVSQKAWDSFKDNIEKLHELGYVHNDLRNPDNILVDSNGDLWLIDFGIAKSRADISEASFKSRVMYEDANVKELESKLFKKQSAAQAEVIESNIRRLTGEERGDMPALLISESMGGNAGAYRGYQCAGANFYYDSKTGEIVYFGNIQNVPSEIRSKYSSGSIKIALNFKTGKSSIVEYFLTVPTSEAVSAIKASIKEYNQKYGFEIEEKITAQRTRETGAADIETLLAANPVTGPFYLAYKGARSLWQKITGKKGKGALEGGQPVVETGKSLEEIIAKPAPEKLTDKNVQEILADAEKRTIIAEELPKHESLLKTLAKYEAPLEGAEEEFVYHEAESKNLDAIYKSGGLDKSIQTKRMQDKIVDMVRQRKFPELEGYSRTGAIYAHPDETLPGYSPDANKDIVLKIKASPETAIVVSSEYVTEAAAQIAGRNIEQLTDAQINELIDEEMFSWSGRYWEGAVSLDIFKSYFKSSEYNRRIYERSATREEISYPEVLIKTNIPNENIQIHKYPDQIQVLFDRLGIKTATQALRLIDESEKITLEKQEIEFFDMVATATAVAPAVNLGYKIGTKLFAKEEIPSELEKTVEDLAERYEALKGKYKSFPRQSYYWANKVLLEKISNIFSGERRSIIAPLIKNYVEHERELNFEEKQLVIDALVYEKILSDSKGAPADFKDYLNDYYKGLGIRFDITFEDLNLDVLDSLVKDLIRDGTSFTPEQQQKLQFIRTELRMNRGAIMLETNYNDILSKFDLSADEKSFFSSIAHLYEGTVEIPFITITYQGETRRIPVLAVALSGGILGTFARWRRYDATVFGRIFIDNGEFKSSLIIMYENLMHETSHAVRRFVSESEYENLYKSWFAEHDKLCKTMDDYFDLWQIGINEDNQDKIDEAKRRIAKLDIEIEKLHEQFDKKKERMERRTDLDLILSEGLAENAAQDFLTLQSKTDKIFDDVALELLGSRIIDAGEYLEGEPQYAIGSLTLQYYLTKYPEMKEQLYKANNAEDLPHFKKIVEQVKRLLEQTTRLAETPITGRFIAEQPQMAET